VAQFTVLPRKLPNERNENQRKFEAVGAQLENITDQLPSTSYKCYLLGQRARTFSATEIMKESQNKLGQAGNVADIDVKRKNYSKFQRNDQNIS